MSFKDYAKKVEELANKMPNIFKYNGDIEKNAYLNWRMRSDLEQTFIEIGKSYLDVSKHLIKTCLHDNSDKKADIWIFPILFNIVHGIELYLKGINSYCRKFLNVDAGDKITKGGHDLRMLCAFSKKYLIEIREEDLLNAIDVISNFIELLYKHTDDMAFARYPVDIKVKKYQFYFKTTENVVIDLPLLLGLYDYFPQMLDHIFWKLYEGVHQEA